MTESSACILSELRSAAQSCNDWPALDVSQNINIHVAIMSEPFLSYVFSGKKTIESRFSLNRITPYNKVNLGDIIFMKAGQVVGCFTVSWVKYFDLTEYPIAEISQQYGKEICGDAAFWERKGSKRYATIMGIKNVQKLTPATITKPDRRAWLTLDSNTTV